MEINNSMPLAALTVSDFRNLIAQLTINQRESLPEVLDKKGCSDFTGYTVSTINQMIVSRGIPHYKRNGKVLFKKSELEAWLFECPVPTKTKKMAEHLKGVVTRAKTI